MASLALYLAFVVTQTVRHRDFFLPVAADGEPLDEDEHADPPTSREAWVSLGFLLLSLVAVVGLAKVESPAIEDGVLAAGLPVSFVGVVIALLVLLPETLAAANAARRERVQTSLNLALGSAMASIGLTIPTLAVASIWIPTPLHLGLGATQIVLLAITVVVGVLTVVPGRATRLQASVHLTLFAAFLFLAMSPDALAMCNRVAPRRPASSPRTSASVGSPGAGRGSARQRRNRQAPATRPQLLGAEGFVQRREQLGRVPGLAASAASARRRTRRLRSGPAP